MIDKENFKKNVYAKYKKYKDSEESNFFHQPLPIKHSFSIHQISHMVAMFVLCFAILAGATYAGSKIYEYVSQEPISPEFDKNPDYYFYQDMNYVHKDGLYYKKIYSYEEYQKYKNRWNALLPMKEEDFKDYFFLIIASENTAGIKLSTIDYDSSTLYVKLDKPRNPDSDNTILGIKISKDMDRENIQPEIIKEVIVPPSGYKKITELSSYTIEDALKDNVFVLKDNKIISSDTAQLDNFLLDVQNGKNSFIRIFSDGYGEIYIEDIQYKNNEFLFNGFDVTNNNFYSDYYARIEKRIFKDLGIFVDLYKDNTINSDNIPVCTIQ